MLNKLILILNQFIMILNKVILILNQFILILNKLILMLKGEDEMAIIDIFFSSGKIHNDMMGAQYSTMRYGHNMDIHIDIGGHRYLNFIDIVICTSLHN